METLYVTRTGRRSFEGHIMRDGSPRCQIITFSLRRAERYANKKGYRMEVK